MSRYTQPEEWPFNADYQKMLKEKITPENIKDYERIRNILIKIPKLGDIGVDELILKLSSHLNSVIK